jgi:hypothetical protein
MRPNLRECARADRTGRGDRALRETAHVGLLKKPAYLLCNCSQTAQFCFGTDFKQYRLTGVS